MIVTDERGAPHYYRVLPTEPTFRKSRLIRVQPLRRWKDGSYHEHGEPQILDDQFAKHLEGMITTDAYGFPSFPRCGLSECEIHYPKEVR